MRPAVHIHHRDEDVDMTPEQVEDLMELDTVVTDRAGETRGLLQGWASPDSVFVLWDGADQASTEKTADLMILMHDDTPEPTDPAVEASREAITRVGHIIRAYLDPLWARFHEADLKWGRIKQIPEIKSTAMCRHTSQFTKRLLASIGEDGWKVTSGVVEDYYMKSRPTYMPEIIPNTMHWWLAHPKHGHLDLTGDQFGFDEVMIGNPDSPVFLGYREHMKPHSAGSILGTMRNWEGDPRGSWWGHEAQAEAYAQLQRDVRNALGIDFTLDADAAPMGPH
jgi:hypothetical protein